MNIALIDEMIQSDCQERYEKSPEHEVAMAVITASFAIADAMKLARKSDLHRRLMQGERHDFEKMQKAIAEFLGER